MITRAVSALVAVFIVFCLGYFGQAQGFLALTALVALLLSLEGVSLLFFDSSSRTIRGLFVFCNLLIFTIFVWVPAYSEVSFALISMIFCSASLLFKRKFSDLTSLTTFQARSLMGFVYLGILPAFAARLLNFEHGVVWYLFLMSAVFAGDTFAYLFGRTLGSRKLMPLVSPKKTLEGSAGGLLGSAAVGVFFALYVLPQAPMAAMVVLALASGLFAQMGDLFESLLKRVANIKDSGKLMPGHGGILDRVDGILFAAPIVLAGAMIIETVFI